MKDFYKTITLISLFITPLITNAQFKVSEDGKSYNAPIEYLYEHLSLITERDSCRSREFEYNRVISIRNNTIENNNHKISKLEKKVKTKNVIIMTVVPILIASFIIR